MEVIVWSFIFGGALILGTIIISVIHNKNH